MTNIIYDNNLNISIITSLMNKNSLNFNRLLTFILVLMILLTRSNYLSAVHLPDFTLPALIIAGMYIGGFMVAFLLIVSAILVDNYAIFYQGISANCITEAYSILLLLYYLVYYLAKFIPTFIIGFNLKFIKSVVFVIAIISLEWLLATASYYAFTEAAWSDFAKYVLNWSFIEIPTTLSQLAVISIIITIFAKFYERRGRLSKANAAQKNLYR